MSRAAVMEKASAKVSSIGMPWMASKDELQAFSQCLEACEEVFLHESGDGFVNGLGRHTGQDDQIRLRKIGLPVLEILSQFLLQSHRINEEQFVACPILQSNDDPAQIPAGRRFVFPAGIVIIGEKNRERDCCR